MVNASAILRLPGDDPGEILRDGVAAMRTNFRQNISSVERALPPEYLTPIALLLTISFACLFGLLLHLTNVQDRLQQNREVELVENVTRSATRLADHDLRDYAVWNDAVVHLVDRFDLECARKSLGPYLVHGQGYELTAVTGASGAPLYIDASIADAEHSKLSSTLGPAFARSLTAVRSRADSDPLISGYSRQGDNIYLFAVSRIVPLSPSARVPRGPFRAMVIARKISPAYLNAILEDSNRPDFRLAFMPAGSSASVPVRSPEGDILGYLNWFPQKPGSTLRWQMLPAFLLVALISLLVASVIVRRGRRSLEALKLSERRAHHLATHDLLTGLPNRRLVQSEVQSRLDDGQPVCVLYMDLDGFKETNDVYGHVAGDALLNSVASRLRSLVSDDMLLARVGGDEFAIVAQSGEAEASSVARSILEGFASAFIVRDYNISLGVSIGISAVSSDEMATIGCDELLRRSDSAMYAAKANGRRSLQVYNPDLDEGRERRQQLETDLASAIASNEIALVYQPIVCAKLHSILCVEALARWKHPTFGLIPPDQFIPIAESSGQIVELGRAVLEAACTEVRDWGVDLAVNLSPAQFWDRDLPHTVAEVLQATAFPAERLELEVTEGYLMRRPEAAGEILKTIKSLGVRIALDDFGTGYASIGYLRQLGFDSIKIDRSFVAASISHERDANLARAIVSIGEALDLPVTAEGVETFAHAKLMQKAGCNRFQGWLFGRPMPAREMGSWLADQMRWAS